MLHKPVLMKALWQWEKLVASKHVGGALGGSGGGDTGGGLGPQPHVPRQWIAVIPPVSRSHEHMPLFLLPSQLVISPVSSNLNGQ